MKITVELHNVAELAALQAALEQFVEIESMHATEEPDRENMQLLAAARVVLASLGVDTHAPSRSDVEAARRKAAHTHP